MRAAERALRQLLRKSDFDFDPSELCDGILVRSWETIGALIGGAEKTARCSPMRRVGSDPECEGSNSVSIWPAILLARK